MTYEQFIRTIEKIWDENTRQLKYDGKQKLYDDSIASLTSVVNEFASLEQRFSSESDEYVSAAYMMLNNM